MPFHPCGRMMDWLRFTYRTKMRLVEGQPGVPIEWLKCRPGAKPLGFPHNYGSRVWEENWRQEIDSGAFGEIYGSRPTWTAPSVGPITNCLKGPYWPERFRPGVPKQDALTYPVLRMDAEGWPVCCCHPCQFVPFHVGCQDWFRMPDQVRLRIFDNGSAFICTQAVGTNLLLTRQPNGKWTGTGVWGSTGEPITAEYPTDKLGSLTCTTIVEFNDHPGTYFAWKIAENPSAQDHTLNPLVFTWPSWTHRVQLPGYFPCGPSGLLFETPATLAGEFN